MRFVLFTCALGLAVTADVDASGLAHVDPEFGRRGGQFTRSVRAEAAEERASEGWLSWAGSLRPVRWARNLTWNLGGRSAVSWISRILEHLGWSCADQQGWVAYWGFPGWLDDVCPLKAMTPEEAQLQFEATASRLDEEEDGSSVDPLDTAWLESLLQAHLAWLQSLQGGDADPLGLEPAVALKEVLEDPRVFKLLTELELEGEDPAVVAQRELIQQVLEGSEGSAVDEDEHAPVTVHSTHTIIEDENAPVTLHSTHTIIHQSDDEHALTPERGPSPVTSPKGSPRKERPLKESPSLGGAEHRSPLSEPLSSPKSPRSEPLSISQSPRAVHLSPPKSPKTVDQPESTANAVDDQVEALAQQLEELEYQVVQSGEVREDVLAQHGFEVDPDEDEPGGLDEDPSGLVARRMAFFSSLAGTLKKRTDCQSGAGPCMVRLRKRGTTQRIVQCTAYLSRSNVCPCNTKYNDGTADQGQPACCGKGCPTERVFVGDHRREE